MLTLPYNRVDPLPLGWDTRSLRFSPKNGKTREDYMYARGTEELGYLFIAFLEKVSKESLIVTKYRASFFSFYNKRTF